MNAENLHDAIGLLPGDLVAETDRRRTRHPRSLRWQRYAAMAACLALMLFAGRFCIQLLSPKTESAAADMAAEVPAAAAPAEEAQAAPMPEAAAGQVPRLTVSSEEETLTLLFLSCHWTVPQGHDSAIAVITDTVPATGLQDLPQIVTGGDSLVLQLPVEPERLAYRCWREEAGQWIPALAEEWNLLTAGPDGSFRLDLQQGSCLYEISLTASQGTAGYAFRAAGPLA